ncbi:MAG: hypothetical protein OXD01_15045, partial [Gammaproteobacteria bacterium]|nr:hypothetical protein [Gammaproteobacteria bacterium]
KSFTLLIILDLIGFNLLTLLSSIVFAAASSVLTTIGFQSTARAVYESRISTRRNAVKRVGNRLTTRATKVATIKTAKLPLKALPLTGIGVLVGGTAWEISMLCEDLRDINSLYSEFEIDSDSTGNALDTVCNMNLPNTNDQSESMIAGVGTKISNYASWIGENISELIDFGTQDIEEESLKEENIQH